jgi:hypothetical protein
LVRFPETNYTGLILEFTGDGGVCILVTQPVDFKNPTWMSVNMLKRCGEVVSASR